MELAVALALGELVATLFMAIVVAVFPSSRPPAPCRVTDPVTYEIRTCETLPDNGVPAMPSSAGAAE